MPTFRIRVGAVALQAARSSSVGLQQPQDRTREFVGWETLDVRSNVTSGGLLDRGVEIEWVACADGVDQGLKFGWRRC
ncbi:hypothetical protein ACFU9W_47700, partial [Streptomyces sp. NPDC057600]|uniref:hypothetical protein n=1 Tax=Streptomyces sp. NPDC057600 TaxID=3346180 RepID=UPI0036BCA772